MDPFAARRNQSSLDWSLSAYSNNMSYEPPSPIAQNSYDCLTCSSAGDLSEQLEHIAIYDEILPPKSKRIRTESSFSMPPGILHSSCAGPVPSEPEREPQMKQPIPLRHCEKLQRRGSGSQSIPNFEKDVPVATEAEWARRAIKRSETVNRVKASSEYLDNQGYTKSVTLIVEVLTPRPQTPDPSKRQSDHDWEAELAEWRSDVRAIVGVRKLVDMGFEEIASVIAWFESTLDEESANDQEAHLNRAIACLTAPIGE